MPRIVSFHPPKHTPQVTSAECESIISTTDGPLLIVMNGRLVKPQILSKYLPPLKATTGECKLQMSLYSIILIVTEGILDPVNSNILDIKCFYQRSSEIWSNREHSSSRKVEVVNPILQQTITNTRGRATITLKLKNSSSYSIKETYGVFLSPCLVIVGKACCIRFSHLAKRSLRKPVWNSLPTAYLRWPSFSVGPMFETI